MAKAIKEVKAQEMPLANPQGKTVEELKEVAVNLQTQVVENQRLANHHQTMATKAQGALEAMLQMIPKEEVEQMIAEEPKVNGEALNDTETAD
jgi:hypothetical protein